MKLTTRPQCALCGCPVADFEERHDAFLGKVAFVATCHGDTHTVVLTEAEADAVRITGFGVAFADRRTLPRPRD